MIRILFPLAVTIQMVLLIGCQYAADVTELPPQPTSTVQPATMERATISPSPPTVAAEVDDQPAKSTIPATEPAQVDDELPTSSPDPYDWDNRDVFIGGLIPGEEKILYELPGATVYHLDIDITNPNLVNGKMEARYTNQEDISLDELILHVFPSHLGGDMTVDNVLVNGKSASPQLDNGILRVPLESPLAPGEQALLALNFVTAVPGNESTKYKVLAYDEGILALAHFYPMFAVFDDQGWHTAPSADHGDETFADMGFYLVRVSAAADDVLVASGVETDRTLDNGRQEVTFAAGPMRDFYLAASKNYEVVQQQVGPVLLSSYAPADRQLGAELVLSVATHSLQSYSNRFGAYPYSELDIVSTPTEALGIEYPGVFANALRIYDLSDGDPDSVPNSVYLESTTAHEAGHQWFYGLVGNDQLNEPWLDESLTQYATWLYYIDRYGEQNAQGFYNSFEGRWERAENPEMPIGLPADAYNGRDYGAIVYGRGPILMNELAGMMGQDTFDEFLLDYSEQFRWQIASSEDFKRLAEQHCQCDLTDFFAEKVFGE